MWNTIQSLLPTKLSKSPNANLNSRNMNSAKESKSIANHFHIFFCTFGKNIAENISDDKDNSHLLFLRKRIPESIFLRLPSMNKVVNSINSFNVNKAVGHDNVPAYFIKIADTTVAPYLQCFIVVSNLHGILSPKLSAC